EPISLKHVSRVPAIGLSRDGKTLARVEGAQSIRLWALSGDAPRERAEITGHDTPVEAIALSPDGRVLACGCADEKRTRDGTFRYVWLWDLTGDRAKERTVIKLDKSFWGMVSMTFSPDGKTLAVGSREGDVELLDATAKQPKEWGRLTHRSRRGFNTATALTL